MEEIRNTLDEMLGKDRDLPRKEKMKLNKHFDSPEVCKFYLLDFCPHDLFVNTKSDLGPCKKRHDHFFKNQFLNDPNRSQYQFKYEDMLMEFLEDLISSVDNKMKKSFERIEAPLPEQEKPRELMEQVHVIDSKIEELVIQAENFGEQGRIEDSEIIMRQIDKLKEQKNDMMMRTDNPLMSKVSQMKVCEICGAMQSAQDNEKRLQTHVEGKLHTGYFKIRQYLDNLRTKKLERKLKLEQERERERMQREYRERERIKEQERKRRGSPSGDHYGRRGKGRDRHDDRRNKGREAYGSERKDKYSKNSHHDDRGSRLGNQKKDRNRRSRSKSKSYSRSRSRRDNHKRKRSYS